ncbi:MAG: hypothetical protein ABIG67_11010 [Pseudomonadota bacterium]
MLETPLWVKILFTIWVIAFIFIEAAWDSIVVWVARKVRSFTKDLHTRHRLRRQAS